MGERHIKVGGEESRPRVSGLGFEEGDGQGLRAAAAEGAAAAVVNEEGNGEGGQAGAPVRWRCAPGAPGGGEK